MTDLRKYQSESVQAMAGSIQSELAAGVPTLEQLSDTLSEFILRDDQGVYWSLAPRSQQWYRHGPGGWTAAVSPPSTFEGPSTLAVWAPKVEKVDGAVKTEVDGKTAANAHAFMENMIADIFGSYERGLITSITASALVSEVFLMDKENRFWTVGFRSKGWYFFEAEKWHKAESPPALDTLVDTKSAENPEEHDQTIINFLVAMAGNPPEPIAEQWDPPDHFPEPVLQCPSCTRVDVGLHSQCKFCNSEIPVTANVSEKTTKFCTQCGHEQPRRIKFCVQCGTKF